MPTKSNENQTDKNSSKDEELIHESEIVNFESDLPKLSIYPLKDIPADNFLTAGFKVKDKLTAFQMLVVGFTNVLYVLDGYNIKNQSYIYEKVFLNVTKKSDNELFKGSEEDNYYYYFFKNAFDSWNSEGMSHGDTLFFICKYWNRDKDEIRHYLKKYFELESV